MILEVAVIRIPAGKQAEFDAAIQRGVETAVSYTHLDVYKRQRG